ncbi:MAG: phospholipase D-like domain-containing protein [Anaerolineales bacterium]
MRNYRNHLKASLIAALGYGLGFAVAVIIIRLVLRLGFLKTAASYFENQHLVFGLLILFSVVILGGSLAGTIGGLLLSYALRSVDRKRTVTRSALGIGVAFGLVLLPITGLLAMLAIYDAGGASPLGFVLSIGVVGAVFGFVTGLATGTLPARVNYWRVTGVTTISFGLGGIAFGFGLWHYFYTLYQSGAAAFELLFAFFVFGAVGGFVLGWIFSLDQEKAAQAREAQEQVQANVIYRAAQWFKQTRFYRKRGFWGTLLFVAILFLISRLLAMSPLRASSAHISAYLPSDTVGVHWSSPWELANVPGTARHPSVAQEGDLLAVVWEQDGEIFLSTSTLGQDTTRVWQPALNVSDSPTVDSLDPQITVDSQGSVHLTWTEAVSGEAGDSSIFYRTCLQENCTPVMSLSNPADENCASTTHQTPAIAVSGSDILVIWSSGTANLPYVTWQIGDDPAMAETGCALAENISGVAANPRLAAQPGSGFDLVFDDGTEIFEAVSSESGFSITTQETGRMPEIFVDAGGGVHTAWCGADGQIQYQAHGSPAQTVPASTCLTRPALGQDAEGTLHLLWYADQVEQPSGQYFDNNVIYENTVRSGTWSEAAIVGRSAAQAQPALVAGTDGLLHLVWETAADEVGSIDYASYQVYTCDPDNLNTQGKLALEVAQSGVYRPADEIVPYCQNQFDRLLILPKADPAYSDVEPTVNGAFDQVSDLIQTAQYEVLFSTMWYKTDDTNTSPGFVLAQGVKGLYDQVKAHPERYPRGMTVRILLDNPPEFVLSRLISQVWNVFQHLRAAGVPTMSDPEIGWKLEVANYDGSWPHAHAKMVVIDGKTAVAAGFNYQHKHLSEDHPSGKGKGEYDLALQMTGPVAQTTQRSFDDLWYGSNRINCPDLGSDSPLWWLSCRREFATTEHVPETNQFYLAQENHNAFATYRTEKFNESDVIVAKAVASAQETLDVLQVNFTLKMICDLNVIFQVCDFSDALTYMDAMMAAIEANQVKTRVLIKPGVIEGVESNVAVEQFRQALKARGLEDLVEFRYFDGTVHAKAVLIDNQFLFVGSQNFHYSAWGDGIGLVEFNIGTDDPDAVSAFKRFFDYQWERGIPVPEE